MLRILFLLVAVLLVVPSPVLGCSAEEGYRTPTNFELVAKADLIVLARVKEGKSPPVEAFLEPTLNLDIHRVLKGDLGSEQPKLVGDLAWNGSRIPPMPTPLGQSHFSAGLGACIRVFYNEDAPVIAMFQKTEQGFLQITDAWARVVEDVEAEDGIWVRAVEEYLDIQSKTRPEQLRAVVAERRELLARRGDLASQTIADDLAGYLKATGTNGATRESPRWRLFDMPKEVAAILGEPESRQIGVLVCREGKADISVDLTLAGSEKELGLRIAGVDYPAVGERMIKREAGGGQEVEVLSGTIRFSTELTNALKEAVGDASILVAEKPLRSAPPLDVLQKFAYRCEALRRSL